MSTQLIHCTSAATSKSSVGVTATPKEMFIGWSKVSASVPAGIATGWKVAGFTPWCAGIVKLKSWK